MSGGVGTTRFARISVLYMRVSAKNTMEYHLVFPNHTLGFVFVKEQVTKRYGSIAGRGTISI